MGEHQTIPILGRALTSLCVRRDEAKPWLILEDGDTGLVSQHGVSHLLGEPRLAGLGQCPERLPISEVGCEMDTGEGATYDVSPPLALLGSFVLGDVSLATDHEVGSVAQSLVFDSRGLQPYASLPLVL